MEDILKKSATNGQYGQDPHDKVVMKMLVVMMVRIMMVMVVVSGLDMIVVMMIIGVFIVIMKLKIVIVTIQEFCTDISSYSPVTWTEEEVEECATHFTGCSSSFYSFGKFYLTLNSNQELLKEEETDLPTSC